MNEITDLNIESFGGMFFPTSSPFIYPTLSPTMTPEVNDDQTMPPEIDDDYYMMKYELDLHRSIRAKRNWLGLYSHMLVGVVKGVELLNNNYKQFTIINGNDKVFNTFVINYTSQIVDNRGVQNRAQGFFLYELISNISLTGNVIGNIITGGVISATGNITTSSQLISSIATGTAPLVVTSTTRVSNLSVNYANVSDYGVVTAQTTGTYYGSSLTIHIATTYIIYMQDLILPALIVQTRNFICILCWKERPMW